MGKHGKRVSIDKNMNLDSGTDVFSNEELLNEYLDSLGVGHASSSTLETNKKGRKHLFSNGNPWGDDHSEDEPEDVTEIINNMLIDNAKSNQNIQKANLMSEYGETESIVNDEKTIITTTSETMTSTVEKTHMKEFSCNAFVKYVKGVKHISLSDISGNATSVVVCSGEMYIKPENIDACLEELYIYRKITGMPSAVYDEDEFVDRMLSKKIYDVDSDRYYFMKSDKFDDIIFAFVIDDDEKNRFVNYIKHALSTEEIPDTILSLLCVMERTSILCGDDLELSKWYLTTYLDQLSLKDYLESDILEHVDQQEDTQVHIDFDDYDTFLTAIYATIGGYVESIEDVTVYKTESMESSIKTQESFEKFNPYNNQIPSTKVEEGEDTGASSDVKTFPGENDESQSREVSGDDTQTSGDFYDVREGSKGVNPNVQDNSQDRDPEEEKEETKVRVDGGNRGSSELKETEIQTTDGHPEITEVDPENFTFKEEKEEKNSMVVDRIICGKK